MMNVQIWKNDENNYNATSYMLATKYRIGKRIKERYHSYYTPTPKLFKESIPLSRHRVRVSYWTKEHFKRVSLRKVFPGRYRVTDYYPKKVRIRRPNRSTTVRILRRIVNYPYTLKIKTRVKIVLYSVIISYYLIKYLPKMYNI